MSRRLRGARWLGAAALVIAATAIGYGLLYAGPEPTLSIEVERPAIGALTEIRAVARQPQGGIARATLTLEQGGRSLELDRLEATGLAPWRFWQTGPLEVQLRAEVGGGNPHWLEEGEAVARVTAWRRAGPLRAPEPTIVERHLPVRLRPPALGLISDSHEVREGGSGMVVFRPGPHVVESGVIAGPARFRSFPAPDGHEGERFVLFGIPLNMADANQVLLYAEDDAGNRSERPFLDALHALLPGADTVLLTNAFLERVVRAIAARTPSFDATGGLLHQYLSINREMRARNRSALAELAERSAPAFLWEGAFVPLEGSVQTGLFGDRRAYSYEGQEVDRQTHLGVDLASVAHAPVRAPNRGKVVFAGFFGIYGNAVVIDHGFGLTSLSAHLSRISVETGQWVAKGQEIGRSGATGIAGGDHLHLGMFIQGTAVDPLQWLDESWVAGPLSRKLSLVLRP